LAEVGQNLNLYIVYLRSRLNLSKERGITLNEKVCGIF
jgi:hypothetical protein